MLSKLLTLYADPSEKHMTQDSIEHKVALFLYEHRSSQDRGMNRGSIFINIVTSQIKSAPQPQIYSF